MTLSVQLLEIPEGEASIQREFFLNGAEFRIGRDYASDICLQDLSGYVSRTHVMLRKTPDGGYLVTNTSTNGTVLNGNQMSSQETLPISDGDIINLGGYRLLFGIAGTKRVVQSKAVDAEIVFKTETDLSSEGALMPNEMIEDVSSLRSREFSQIDVDLESDMMFDPFATGPEIDESVTGQGAKQETLVLRQADVIPARTEFGGLPSLSLSDDELPAQYGGSIDPVLYRDQVLKSMEHAFELFLDEIDPQKLQSDYNDYISRLVSRRKRYWQIHSRQFEKKRANGEFQRNFLALFAQEMWKK